MHPLITAWIRYLALADLQVSYYAPNRMYGQWVAACRKEHDWLKEIEISC
jgi:hypothetical protein